MRSFLCLPILLSACAHSIPPELRDPIAHIRPIETQSSGSEIDAINIVSKDDAQDCETRRFAALGHDRSALQAFARCAMAKGEYARAYHALDDQNVPERVTAGLLSGKLNASEEHLNTALELSPHSAELWNLLGSEYERQGRDAEAIDAYLRAKSLG